MEALDDITAIALKAGELILGLQASALNVQTKEHAFDFVTNADVAAERLIIERLRERFPNDSILAEENGHQGALGAERVWMIDPLDGTKAYVAGEQGYSVMIGLCERGVPVMGVVFIPAEDKLYTAARGQGAWLTTAGTKRKIQVSTIDRPDLARMITRAIDAERRPVDALYDAFPNVQRIPATTTGSKFGLISEGAAEFVINTNHRVSKWDTCAPQVILEEAGGVVTDIDGKSLNYAQTEDRWAQPLLISNNTLHQKLLTAINLFKQEHAGIEFPAPRTL